MATDIPTGIAQRALDNAHRRKANAAHKSHSQSEIRRQAGQARVQEAVGAGQPTVIRVPITNTLDGSDYSATIAVGSQQAPVNVILDTGSSTLGVDPGAYNGTGDTALVPSAFAQIVTYGTGGWAGPVVNTSVNLGGVLLPSAPVAIASVQEQGNFVGVTGILGLAYYQLNDDYDFSAALSQQGGKASTYPWTLSTTVWATAVKQLDRLIRKYQLPQGTLTPYFDELENKGVVANKFAFYVKRSWVSMQTQNPQTDPLNQGVFVLGGGEEQTDLFKGDFVNVAVLDDVYYNTNLKSVRVGALPAVAAQPLQTQYQQDMITNAIVDSGTSDLTLAADVYKAILDGLAQTNPEFGQLVQAALKAGQQNLGISAASLNLPAWPTIYFTLSGENGEDVELSCTPSTYWQVDFPAQGQAMFQVSGPLAHANQSILGLPLLNNYYSVFDRSQDSQGVIRFAPIA